MSKAQHTPTPWKVSKTERGGHMIVGSNDKIVAIPTELIPISEQIANEQIIVKAVNCHHELLAALEAVLRHGLIEDDGYEAVLKQVISAIDKAKAQ